MNLYRREEMVSGVAVATRERTVSGGYPRGEETKQRIICVAIDMFGREGFAASSTRDIASAAGVNTPAIQYYFGGKLGLYTACIDQLTSRVWQRIGPPIQRCRAGASEAELAELIAMLGDVQDCLIDAFFTDDEGDAIRRLMTWEEAENGGKISDQLMRERIGLPIFQAYQAVVERIAGDRLDRIALDLHALSLMGLSTIFHFKQCHVMDMVSWSASDEALFTPIKEATRRQLGYALTGLSEATAMPAPA